MQAKIDLGKQCTAFCMFQVTLQIKHLTQLSLIQSHDFTLVTRIFPIALWISDNLLFERPFSAIFHQPVLHNSESGSCLSAVHWLNIVTLCCTPQFSISVCGRHCYIKYNHSCICLYTRITLFQIRQEICGGIEPSLFFCGLSAAFIIYPKRWWSAMASELSPA